MENEQPIPLVMLDPVSGEYIALLKALNDNNIKYLERNRAIAGRHTIHHRVEILINPSDQLKAISILKKLDAELSEAIPSFCPQCDSEKIIEKIKLGFLGLFQKKVFRCEDCGYEWKPSPVQ